MTRITQILSALLHACVAFWMPGAYTGFGDIQKGELWK